jgi:hypothetical protein
LWWLSFDNARLGSWDGCLHAYEEGEGGGEKINDVVPTHLKECEQNEQQDAGTRHNSLWWVKGNKEVALELLNDFVQCAELVVAAAKDTTTTIDSWAGRLFLSSTHV